MIVMLYKAACNWLHLNFSLPASYDLSGQSGFSWIWNGRHRGLISSENLSIGFFNFTSAMSGVCWYFWIKDS